jgi:1,5-anhydro-D-fructose reductase (1,5-anhydro-D-mannitol-forming)
MTTLGWGVIGLGNIVHTTIAPALVAEPSCDLVAAVSRDQGRADAFAAKFGARFAYDDYDRMLANPEVEAVFIATPNSLHAKEVVAAARAGKHVLCDKPMATNVPDAMQEVEECRRAGVKFGINFHNRHLDWVRDVKAMLAGGAIGEVQAVEVEVGSGTRLYDNWRTDPEMAGLGSIYNVGVHALDFLRLILASEAVEVAAMFDQDPGGGTLERLGMVLIRFANGTMAYANCNERLAYPRNDVVFFGSRGRIAGLGLTRARVDGYVTVLTEEGETTTSYPAPGAHQRSVAAFTKAVLADQEPDASGIDGLRSMQLCDAIARSVAERRVVQVDHTDP